MDTVRLRGYVPGAIGRITELHASYYSHQWRFGLFFEAKVAKELSEFLSRFDEKCDGFWIATIHKEAVGAIAIVGDRENTKEARLRWFIVAREYQGLGIGNRLMKEAMKFCRRSGFKRVYLTTFAGLDPARHLYEKWGFTLEEETEDATWGVPVKEQLFELNL
jgi:GNAT superfamily N-acetyltransferase